MPLMMPLMTHIRSYIEILFTVLVPNFRGQPDVKAVQYTITM